MINPSEREKKGLEDVEQRDKVTAASGLVKGETACNRSACQAPLVKGVRWWNTGVRAWYCFECAMRINNACKPPPLCVHEMKAKPGEP